MFTITTTLSCMIYLHVKKDLRLLSTSMLSEIATQAANTFATQLDGNINMGAHFSTNDILTRSAEEPMNNGDCLLYTSRCV